MLRITHIEVVTCDAPVRCSACNTIIRRNLPCTVLLYHGSVTLDGSVDHPHRGQPHTAVTEDSASDDTDVRDTLRDTLRGAVDGLGDGGAAADLGPQQLGFFCEWCSLDMLVKGIITAAQLTAGESAGLWAKWVQAPYNPKEPRTPFYRRRLRATEVPL